MKPAKVVAIDEEGQTCIECGKDFEIGEKALEEFQGMLCLQCDIEAFMEFDEEERYRGFEGE